MKIITFAAIAVALSLAQLRGQTAIDSFDPHPNAPIYAVAVQPDGKILIAGSFTTLSPDGGVTVPRSNFARLNPDGSLDTAFDPNVNSSVHAIIVLPDGKILIGGSFNFVSGKLHQCIARLDATTGLPDSFAPYANIYVWSMAVQADGKILLGGSFGLVSGQNRENIARLDPTTGLADSFDPQANSSVTSIALQPDGKILVCGWFTQIGGQARNNIARLDPVTGLADSFDPKPEPGPPSPGHSQNIVRAIAVQADGKIVLGGSFTAIGGQARNKIARLDPVTGLADSFDPSASNDVVSLAVQADGKILAGGWFSSIGGQTRNRVARLDPVTGLADSFDPNVNNFVHAVAPQADGKVLIAGEFQGPSSVGGQTRYRIARTMDLVLRTTTMTRAGNQVVVTFDAIGGRTHRLERTSSLDAQPDWEAVPMVDDITPSNNGAAELIDPNSPSDRAFYRVRLLPF